MVKFSSNIRIQLISTKKDIAQSRIAFSYQDIISKTDPRSQKLSIITHFSGQKNVILNRSDWHQDNTVSDEMISSIRNYLCQGEYVEGILFMKEGNILHIWTVVSSYSDEKCRRAIYNQECLLMKDISSKRNLHFDFYLIEPQEVGDLLSSGAILIYDRKENDEKK